MTDDELRAREAIRDTLARYNMAGDRLRTDDFLALFTEDAVFESANRVHGGGWRHEGRAAIAAWLGGWGKAGPAPATPDRPRPAFARHHLATCLIELDGGGADLLDGVHAARPRSWRRPRRSLPAGGCALADRPPPYPHRVARTGSLFAPAG